MNTSFLGPAVATVLTACGIETTTDDYETEIDKLQQYLPLAVLKLSISRIASYILFVATVLTACGIETLMLHT